MKMTGTEIARGKANELPVSPKHAIEIAAFILHKQVNVVIPYLEAVAVGKKAIPFKKFCRDVSHRRCLTGWVIGRYPRKASLAYIRLLRSIQQNAGYVGMDPEKLEIIHASANRGRGLRSVFPRAMGRATPKRRETVNIEIVVREVE
jgi:large subunit ribosomal protein L22